MRLLSKILLCLFLISAVAHAEPGAGTNNKKEEGGEDPETTETVQEAQNTLGGHEAKTKAVQAQPLDPGARSNFINSANRLGILNAEMEAMKQSNEYDNKKLEAIRLMMAMRLMQPSVPSKPKAKNEPAAAPRAETKLFEIPALPANPVSAVQPTDAFDTPSDGADYVITTIANEKPAVAPREEIANTAVTDVSGGTNYIVPAGRSEPLSQNFFSKIDQLNEKGGSPQDKRIRFNDQQVRAPQVDTDRPDIPAGPDGLQLLAAKMAESPQLRDAVKNFLEGIAKADALPDKGMRRFQEAVQKASESPAVFESLVSSVSNYLRKRASDGKLSNTELALLAPAFGAKSDAPERKLASIETNRASDGITTPAPTPEPSIPLSYVLLGLAFCFSIWFFGGRQKPIVAVAVVRQEPKPSTPVRVIEPKQLPKKSR